MNLVIYIPKANNCVCVCVDFVFIVINTNLVQMSINEKLIDCVSWSN